MTRQYKKLFHKKKGKFIQLKGERKWTWFTEVRERTGYQTPFSLEPPVGAVGISSPTALTPETALRVVRVCGSTSGKETQAD